MSTESVLNWENKRLDEVVDILDSRRVPINAKERATREGDVPYFGATGQVGWIDDYLFDEEIILLGEDGAPFLDSSKQKAYVVRGKSWVNNHAHVLRAKPGVPALYLKYWLDKLDYRPFVNGTTRLKLTQGEMRNIPVAMAPERKRYEIVAEIEKQFSRLDEAVANLKRVKANLKRYKAAVLKAAVEGRLVPTEAELAEKERRTYETGEKLLLRTLEARRERLNGKCKLKELPAPEIAGLPDLPPGWIYSNGAQLFGWSSGVNLPIKNLVGGDFPVYGGNGINGWHTEANVAYPTLVIGRVGAGCGNLNVVNQPAWVTDNAIYAVSVPIDCSLTYLGMVLTVANLNSVAAGSGQPFVNQTILNETVIALPPRLEQVRIVDEVERHLSLSRGVEAQIDANVTRGERLRQAILKTAFDGEDGSETSK